MGEEAEWVTWPQAAEMVGCPIPTIDWYTRLGRIQKRPFQGRRATLNRASVEEFAIWWRDRQDARMLKARQRAEAKARRTRGPRPPAPTGWVSAQDAASVLGVSGGQVLWLVRRGHVEGERTGRRWWVTADSLARLVTSR